MVDRILKYEELDEQLVSVFEYLGIPFKDALGIYSKSGYRSDNGYREVYSVKQKSMVSELFKEEIDLHVYVF